MAEINKVLNPTQYYSHYVSLNVRPDGRPFDGFRPVIVNLGSIKTADASSLVKFGNTTVVCGIKLELAAPKAEEPDVGYLVSNLELPTLCSPRSRPGPPSELVQALSTLLTSAVVGSRCVDLRDLCVVPDKLVWVLYCDVCCTDNDGSVLDCALAALMAALKTLTLPHVEYNTETEECIVDPTKRLPLKVNGLPVFSSFSIYTSDLLIADPNAYEEELCGGAGSNFTVSWNKGKGTLNVQKLGSHTIPLTVHQNAFRVAEKKAALVEKTIEAALNNTHP